MKAAGFHSKVTKRQFLFKGIGVFRLFQKELSLMAYREKT